MPVIRTYHCDNCEQEFEVTQNMADSAPDCPFCAKVLEWQPGLFAVKTNKSRAMDVTQQVLEQDFGLTNFNDNMREGDVATKAIPDKGTQQRDAEIRQLSEVALAMGQPMSEQQQQMAQSYWGGGAVSQTMPAGTLLAGAKASTAAANAEGYNPMTLLAKAGKSGKLPIKINSIAGDRRGTFDL